MLPPPVTAALTGVLGGFCWQHVQTYDVISSHFLLLLIALAVGAFFGYHQNARRRRNLFWGGLSLHGGLNIIALIKLQVSPNDTGSFFNILLSMLMLGGSLPHIIQVECARQEVLSFGLVSGCAVEAILSGHMISLKFLLSTTMVLCGLGGLSFETKSKDQQGYNTVSDEGQQAFMPTTIRHLKQYSPHFLLSLRGLEFNVREKRSPKRVVHLTSRQASNEKNKKKKDLTPQDLVKIQKHQDTVAKAEVGTDIRWDVVLQEMSRADAEKRDGNAKNGKPKVEEPKKEDGDDIDSIFVPGLTEPISSEGNEKTAASSAFNAGVGTSNQESWTTVTTKSSSPKDRKKSSASMPSSPAPGSTPVISSSSMEKTDEKKDEEKTTSATGGTAAEKKMNKKTEKDNTTDKNKHEEKTTTTAVKKEEEAATAGVLVEKNKKEKKKGKKSKETVTGVLVEKDQTPSTASSPKNAAAVMTATIATTTTGTTSQVTASPLSAASRKEEEKKKSSNVERYGSGEVDEKEEEEEEEEGTENENESQPGALSGSPKNETSIERMVASMASSQNYTIGDEVDDDGFILSTGRGKRHKERKKDEKEEGKKETSPSTKRIGTSGGGGSRETITAVAGGSTTTTTTNTGGQPIPKNKEEKEKSGGEKEKSLEKTMAVGSVLPPALLEPPPGLNVKPQAPLEPPPGLNTSAIPPKKETLQAKKVYDEKLITVQRSKSPQGAPLVPEPSVPPSPSQPAPQGTQNAMIKGKEKESTNNTSKTTSPKASEKVAGGGAIVKAAQKGDERKSPEKARREEEAHKKSAAKQEESSGVKKKGLQDAKKGEVAPSSDRLSTSSPSNEKTPRSSKEEQALSNKAKASADVVTGAAVAAAARSSNKEESKRTPLLADTVNGKKKKEDQGPVVGVPGEKAKEKGKKKGAATATIPISEDIKNVSSKSPRHLDAKDASPPGVERKKKDNKVGQGQNEVVAGQNTLNSTDKMGSLREKKSEKKKKKKDEMANKSGAGNDVDQLGLGLAATSARPPAASRSTADDGASDQKKKGELSPVKGKKGAKSPTSRAEEEVKLKIKKTLDKKKAKSTIVPTAISSLPPGLKVDGDDKEAHGLKAEARAFVPSGKPSGWNVDAAPFTLNPGAAEFRPLTGGLGSVDVTPRAGMNPGLPPWAAPEDTNDPLWHSPPAHDVDSPEGPLHARAAIDKMVADMTMNLRQQAWREMAAQPNPWSKGDKGSAPILPTSLPVVPGPVAVAPPPHFPAAGKGQWAMDLSNEGNPWANCALGTDAIQKVDEKEPWMETWMDDQIDTLGLEWTSKEMANFGLRAEAKEFPCPRLKDSPDGVGPTQAEISSVPGPAPTPAPAPTNTRKEKGKKSEGSMSAGGKLRADAQVFHPTYEPQQFGANPLFAELGLPHGAKFPHSSDRIIDDRLPGTHEEQMLNSLLLMRGNGMERNGYDVALMEDFGIPGGRGSGSGAFPGQVGVETQSKKKGVPNAGCGKTPAKQKGDSIRKRYEGDTPDDVGFDTEAKIWAYRDPKGRPHMGFSSIHMRQWYSAGYFDARTANLDSEGQWDLTLALLPLSAVGRELTVKQQKELEPHLAWYSVRDLYPRGTRPFKDRPVLECPVVGI